MFIGRPCLVKRQGCSYDILFGEYKSRKKQRCSYVGAVW